MLLLVINYMERRPEYNKDDIQKIKTRLENETKKNRPQKYDWLEDENLPAGNVGYCYKYFLSPSSVTNIPFSS